MFPKLGRLREPRSEKKVVLRCWKNVQGLEVERSGDQELSNDGEAASGVRGQGWVGSEKVCKVVARNTNLIPLRL